MTGQWGYGTGDDDAAEEADGSEWGQETSALEAQQSSNGQFQWVYGEGDTVDTEDSEESFDGIETDHVSADPINCLDNNAEDDQPQEASANGVDTQTLSPASKSTTNSGALQHPTFVSIKPLVRGTTDDYVSKKGHYRVRTKYVGRHNRAKDGIIQAMLKS